MKKIGKSFTFWCILLSFFEIYMHQIGQDSKSIGLIAMNPMLHMLSGIDSITSFLDSGFIVTCRTITGSISIYWYVGSLISFAIYGIVLDSLCFFWKKYRSTKS